MPQDNRIVIIAGAALAVLAALIVAMVFGASDPRSKAAPPASKGGLVVDVADAPGLDAERALSCYVGTQVVTTTLADCARRNGVATERLDVGLDDSGMRVASRPPPGPPPLTGLDEEVVVTQPVESIETVPEAQPAAPASGGSCMIHDGQWRTVASGVDLNRCVRALYAGRCVRPGEALYGRWGDSTLRLLPRRVEQSADNTRFRVLTRQDRACQFPDLP